MSLLATSLGAEGCLREAVEAAGWACWLCGVDQRHLPGDERIRPKRIGPEVAEVAILLLDGTGACGETKGGAVLPLAVGLFDRNWAGQQGSVETCQLGAS